MPHIQKHIFYFDLLFLSFFEFFSFTFCFDTCSSISQITLFISFLCSKKKNSFLYQWNLASAPVITVAGSFSVSGPIYENILERFFTLHF